MKHLSKELINAIAEDARNSPRLRKNHNFHDLSERVQRFLNVLQPGTYVRPHRHRRPEGVNGFEFFLVLQGALGVLLFSEDGQVIHQEYLSSDGELRGIELAEGVFHTLVALSDNTVILELKEGPYNMADDKEFLSQFPMEGEAGVGDCLERWQKGFRGEWGVGSGE